MPQVNKVCGLPLVGEFDDEDAPLEAVVIIKALNSEGDVYYATRTTENLTSVEALGMMEYGHMRLKFALHSSWSDPEGAEE